MCDEFMVFFCFFIWIRSKIKKRKVKKTMMIPIILILVANPVAKPCKNANFIFLVSRNLLRVKIETIKADKKGRSFGL